MNSTQIPPSDVRPEFFVVVIPGLEEVAVEEVKAWLEGADPDAEITVERGGLRIRTELEAGLALNRTLKTATRILLRWSEFGCRDFPKLFRKISGLPWGDWIGDDQAVEFHVSSHSSRLRVKKRIEETCLDARKAYLKKKGAAGQPKSAASAPRAADPTSSAAVYVRLLDDVCMVSLDTSGEILHKRGLRAFSSEAPLRESIAASLLLLLEDLAPAPATSIELVDPMTGGGTFLLEACGLNQVVRTREFAFETFAPLLKRVGKIPDLASERGSVYGSFVGYDSSEKALSSARENLEPALKDRKLSLRSEDFMKAEPLPNGLERWLIANPPYGERIRVEGGLSAFYSRLFEASERVARPARACFLLPAKVKPQAIRAPRSWKLVKEQRFTNGGLPVVAAFFVRRSDV